MRGSKSCSHDRRSRSQHRSRSSSEVRSSPMSTHSHEEQIKKDPPNENGKNAPLSDPEKENGTGLSLEEVAQIFGKPLYEERGRGPNLNSELADRLKEILVKGLPAEPLKDLLIKYPLPNNCDRFGAPKLNEIINFVPNTVSLRDQRIIKRQEKIAVALSAISQIISWMENLKSTPGWKIALETLCDASKLIADLQHEESLIRRNLILSSVDDSMKEMLLTTTIGEFLFGDELEEKIKTAKALQSAAKELRKNTKVTNQQKASKNFKAPPRAQRQNFRQQLDASGGTKPRNHLSRKRGNHQQHYRVQQKKDRSPRRRW